MDLSDCERDENGNIIEPIYGDIVPLERVIVVDRTCMDKQFLLEYVTFNDLNNPFTRKPLSDYILTELEEYRKGHLILLQVTNEYERLFDFGREVFTYIEDFLSVGDVIVAVARLTRKTLSMLELSIVNEDSGLYLQDMDPDTKVIDIVEGNKIRVRLLTSDSRSDTRLLQNFLYKNKRYSGIAGVVDARPLVEETVVPDPRGRRSRSASPQPRYYMGRSRSPMRGVRSRSPSPTIDPVSRVRLVESPLNSGIYTVSVAYGNNVFMSVSDIPFTAAIVLRDIQHAKWYAYRSDEGYYMWDIDILPNINIDEALTREGMPIGSRSYIEQYNERGVSQPNAPTSFGFVATIVMEFGLRLPNPDETWTSEAAQRPVSRRLSYSSSSDTEEQRSRSPSPQRTPSSYYWYPSKYIDNNFAWDVTTSNNPTIPEEYDGRPMDTALSYLIREYNTGHNPEELFAINYLEPIMKSIVTNGERLPDIGSTVPWRSTRYAPNEMLWFPDHYDGRLDRTMWTLVEPNSVVDRDHQIMSERDAEAVLAYNELPRHRRRDDYSPVLISSMSNNVLDLIRSGDTLPDPSVASSYTQERMIWSPVKVYGRWRWKLIPYNGWSAPGDYNGSSIVEDVALVESINAYRSGTEFYDLPNIGYLRQHLDSFTLDMISSGFNVPAPEENVVDLSR